MLQLLRGSCSSYWVGFKTLKSVGGDLCSTENICDGPWLSCEQETPPGEHSWCVITPAIGPLEGREFPVSKETASYPASPNNSVLKITLLLRMAPSTSAHSKFCPYSETPTLANCIRTAGEGWLMEQKEEARGMASADDCFTKTALDFCSTSLFLFGREVSKLTPWLFF